MKKNTTDRNNYDRFYLLWKNWESNLFGFLSKNDKAYYAKELLNTNKKYLKSASVLELGFGNGAFLEYARQNNWNIEGTEVNSDLVIKGKNHGYNVYHADNVSQFERCRYDLVVAFDVIEHLQHERFLELIKDVERILKPGGCFIVRFPNGDSPFGLINQNGDVTHANAIGVVKIRYYATVSELKVIYYGGASEPIIGVSSIYFIHRLIFVPIKKAINLAIRIIFFPRNNIPFCSANAVAIFQKTIEQI